METRELQERLTALGMAPGSIDGIEGPATRTAAARFQVACALPGHHLVVDAVPGPRTWAAVREASDTGRLSPHFSVRELRSKGDGTCWVHRDLLHALEALRARVGRPLSVVSAWRDVAHNRRVGGASASQHTFGAALELERITPRLARGAHLRAGRAADFNRGYVTLQDATGFGIFGGLGHRDGWVTHVDTRAGDPTRPTTWRYG